MSRNSNSRMIRSTLYDYKDIKYQTKKDVLENIPMIISSIKSDDLNDRNINTEITKITKLKDMKVMSSQNNGTYQEIIMEDSDLSTIVDLYKTYLKTTNKKNNINIDYYEEKQKIAEGLEKIYKQFKRPTPKPRTTHRKNLMTNIKTFNKSKLHRVSSRRTKHRKSSNRAPTKNASIVVYH